SSSSSSTSSTSSSSSQSSTDQQVIDSLVDDATGISLKNADLVKAGLKLSVTKVNTDDQNADTYDIKLTDPQGQPVHQ
ncbi:dipeptidase, partial [Limosilactobacillus reuteri]